ncbi:MAG TPA: FtsX-like permease family protein [Vicinamibacterales bacterium]|nr:FtsX-like permease family protein [Vicinamibacterales bacterium]
MAVFRPGKADADLVREIDSHLQLLEDQFVAQGMTREDARYAARRAFGGIEQAKELQRDERSLRWLAGWPMDLKLGVRMLAKSPGLTVIAVIALAVAIGAGAAYLEFVTDLLRPSLASPGGDRIVGVRVWNTARRETEARLLHDFAVWRREARAFEDLGAVRRLNRPLITGDGRADPARGAEITAASFRLLAATPLMGRALLEDDEQPGAPPVVVIGHDLWQTRFSGDPDIVGRTVQLGAVAHTIAGVMPEAFGFPVNQNLWAPLKVQTGELRRGEGDEIQIFGRLKDGVSAGAARAELSAMLAAAAEGPAPAPALVVDVRPYLESMLSAETSRASIERLLYSGNLLFVMLLAICGANVATLVFARTATREAEIAIRTALGASRRRISAQLFAEALVLSLVATLAGLMLAGFVGRWLGRVASEAIGQPLPFWWNANLSPETILYSIALAVFAALIAGVIPALKATGANLQGRLREAGAGGSSMKFGRMWTGIIVTQVAITVIFLSALVSLGWTTYRGRQNRDVTFDRDQFLTARLVVDTAGAGEPASHPAYRALADRLRAEPGIVNVTYATELPGTTFGRFRLEFSSTGSGQAVEGVAAGAVPHSDGLWSRSARVGPSYFETVGIPLVAGRVFTESEIEGNRPVAIVDETFVRLILGGRSAVGLMVREPAAEAGGAPGPWHEIVGVVRDVTIRARKKSYDSMLYSPAAIGAAPPVHLLVRTRGAASPMSHSLPAAALSATPDVRLADVKSLDRAADEEALAMRIFVRIFAVVAAIGLLLSTAGIYALVSFTLARRTREIGIRVALGAAPRRIITSTFSRAFLQVAAGVLLGGVPSAALLMLGVEDEGGLRGPGLVVMLLVGLFVIAVAMVSCAVPLRRALRIEPMQALRAEA